MYEKTLMCLFSVKVCGVEVGGIKLNICGFLVNSFGVSFDLYPYIVLYWPLFLWIVGGKKLEHMMIT